MTATTSRVVGADDADMAVAVNRLIALKGGFVVAADGEVLAELALPLAGLMSLRAVRGGARDALHGAARGGDGRSAARCPSRSCRSPSCRCR